MNSVFTSTAYTNLPFTVDEMGNIGILILVNIDKRFTTSARRFKESGKVFIDFYKKAYLKGQNIGKIEFTEDALRVAYQAVKTVVDRIENGYEPNLEHKLDNLICLENKIFFMFPENSHVKYHG